jgi:death-on-curing protein
MAEPKFLTLAQVFEIHRMQLQLFGGQDGVRDQGALESAIAQPEVGFGGQYSHAFPYGMAAAYAFHVAENQPFVDGNKRVALDCALTFLAGNGIDIQDPDMRLFSAMIDIANKRLTKQGLEALFERLSNETI